MRAKECPWAAAPLGDPSLRPPGWFQGSVYHIPSCANTKLYTLGGKEKRHERSGTWDTCVLWESCEAGATWTNFIISYGNSTKEKNSQKKILALFTSFVYYIIATSFYFLPLFSKSNLMKLNEDIYISIYPVWIQFLKNFLLWEGLILIKLLVFFFSTMENINIERIKDSFIPRDFNIALRARWFGKDGSKILLFMRHVKKAETKALCNAAKFQDFNGIFVSPCIEFSQGNTAAFRCAIVLASRLSQGLFTCLHINYFGYLIHSIKGFVTPWERRLRKMALRKA